jgi:hypothetical protein
VAEHVAAQVEAAAAVGPAAKKQKTKPKVQNVSDALKRLGVVMKKEEKFPKATTMFVQLLENNMTEANSGEFLAVIEGAMERRTWIHAQDKRASYAKLVQAALKQREMFAEEQHWKMELYEFDVLKHATLFTDDSYGFPSAVNAVQYDIEAKLTALAGGAAGLTSPRPSIPGTLAFVKRKAWEVAIMAALSKSHSCRRRRRRRRRRRPCRSMLHLLYYACSPQFHPSLLMPPQSRALSCLRTVCCVGRCCGLWPACLPACSDGSGAEQVPMGEGPGGEDHRQGVRDALHVRHAGEQSAGGTMAADGCCIECKIARRSGAARRRGVRE